MFWRDGAFHVEGSGDKDDRPDAETVFLALLDRMTAEGQALSHNSRAGNYAPTQLLSRPERFGYRKPDFVQAMQALLSRGEIRIEEYGRPSHRMNRIVRGEPIPF